MSEFPPPPPQPEQNPYGAPSYQSGPPQYGQNPYPPAPPSSQDYGSVPTKRPGVTTAAGVITIVLSSLSVIGGAIFGFVMLAVSESDLDPDQRADIYQEFSDAGLDGWTVDRMLNLLGIGSLIFAGLCLVGVVLGILVLRRSNAARITLTVFAGLTIASSLLGIAAVFPLLWTFGAILVIVFLFNKQSSSWFRTK
ncbi:MAG: hypothetical protein ACSLEW_12590 [Nocardioides sp.]